MDDVEQYLQQSSELVQLSEFLDDDHARYALGLIRKLIQKPDVPIAALQPTIVQLQSIAAQSKMLAKYYQTIGKAITGASHYKNLYYSLSEELDKLVMALKKAV